MYQEIGLKPSQNTMLIEKEWPEEKLHLASHQLISMLSLSSYKFTTNYN